MSIKYHDVNVGVTLGEGGCGGGVLPAGYVQLEYIQSTGLEYIDSGVRDSNGLLLKGSVCYTAMRGSWDTICGAQDAEYTLNADGLIMTYSNTGAYSSYVSNAGYNTNIPVELGKLAEIVSDTRGGGHYFLVDGVRYFRSVSGSRGSTYNVFLFALNSAGSFSYSAIARIKHLALYNTAGSLVRDYYAAQRDADGVLGMYDLVSNTFFMNQGTGGFVAGPPITQ